MTWRPLIALLFFGTVAVLLVWVGVVFGALMTSAALRQIGARRAADLSRLVFVWLTNGRFRLLWRVLKAPHRCDAARAARLAEKLLLRVAVPDGTVLNAVVNAFIFGGRYKEAVDACDRWSPPAAARMREKDTQHWALLHINAAEAEYNLHAWEAASARLDAIATDAERFPICRAGLHQQRAWILAHRGAAREALHELAQMDIGGLPLAYHAEHHFTRGAALLASPETAGTARAPIQAGLAIVRRPSSERNGLILLARAALAEAKLDEALRLFERAAGHAYRGQAGPGLLAHGDALVQAGRHDEARAIWRLIKERDPQSPCADIASRREAAL